MMYDNHHHERKRSPETNDLLTAILAPIGRESQEEDIYANISLYAFSSRLNALINSIFMLFHAHEYSRCNAMPLARTGFVH
eukprot:scaffold1931_cov281-Chaetoceros_neogracile.AAC.8